MKKMIKKKNLLLIIGCALLHWPCANAATYVSRQGIDSLLNRTRPVVVYPNPVLNELHVQSRNTGVGAVRNGWQDGNESSKYRKKQSVECVCITAWCLSAESHL
jgi:hypothetical protein